MSFWSWVSGERPKSAALVEAARALTEQQRYDIQKQYALAAGKVVKSASQLEGVPLSDVAFLEHLCRLPATEHLSQQLVKLVKGIGGQDCISLDAVIIVKARLECMGAEEARNTCFSLLQGRSYKNSIHHPLSREELKEVVASATRIALKIDKVPEHVVEATVKGAIQQCGDSGGVGLSQDGYSKWIKLFPAVHKVLCGLMSNVGRIDGAIDTGVLTPLPEMIIPPQHDPARLMLQQDWAWGVCGCLPADCQRTWRLLFNSARDGQSFSTFTGKLVELAPTLLLVQDKGGSMFGGFATQPWEKKGTFYGDSGCFIFGLLPKLVMYPATGINSNFQWCGINFSQLPNGVGLGGQVGHFGLFLDSTFDSGISRPIATFANECLASTQAFEVEAVECWLMKPPEDVSADGMSAGNSVLARNEEVRHFMELAGVNVNHSEGVRMEPPLELEL